MLVTQACLTLCDTMPGCSVHGILQATILERVDIPFSRGSSRPRDWTWFSHIDGRFFTLWATKEAHKRSVVLVKWVSEWMKLFYIIISHSVNKICFHTLAKIFRDPPQSFLGSFQDGESSDQIQFWDVQNLTTHHFLNICFLTLKKKGGKTQQKLYFRDELTQNFLSHFFT